MSESFSSFHAPRRIYLIRHGESIATRDPSVFGRRNPETLGLTQWGHRQAQETGLKLRDLYTSDPILKGRKIHLYYNSHLRIIESASAFAKGFALDIPHWREDALLAERNHGAFDGLDRMTQKRLFPEVYERLHESGDAEERYTTRMPGGESLEDVTERLREFTETLQTELASEPLTDAVIITHGGNCEALRRILCNQSPDLHPVIPGTGDILAVETDFTSPGRVETIWRGQKRQEEFPGNTQPDTQEIPLSFLLVAQMQRQYEYAA